MHPAEHHFCAAVDVETKAIRSDYRGKEADIPRTYMCTVDGVTEQREMAPLLYKFVRAKLTDFILMDCLAGGETSNAAESMHSTESRLGDKNVNRCGGWRGRGTVALAATQTATDSIAQTRENIMSDMGVVMTDKHWEHESSSDKRRLQERVSKAQPAAKARRNMRKNMTRDGGMIPYHLNAAMRANQTRDRLAVAEYEQLATLQGRTCVELAGKLEHWEAAAAKRARGPTPNDLNKIEKAQEALATCLRDARNLKSKLLSRDGEVACAARLSDAEKRAEEGGSELQKGARKRARSEPGIAAGTEYRGKGAAISDAVLCSQAIVRARASAPAVLTATQKRRKKAFKRT